MARYYQLLPGFRDGLPPLSAVLLLALAWILPNFGCAGPRNAAPQVDPEKLSDTAFQAYLAETPLVTVDEAYRAMLILADGEDTSKGFEERRTKLEGRGIARSNWGLEPRNVVDFGSVAFMTCRICQLRGGINYNLLASWGPGDRRYALRELVFEGMLEDTVEYQYTTGPALAALMAKADERMEKKGLYPSERIELNDETARDVQGNLIVPPPASEPAKP